MENYNSYIGRLDYSKFIQFAKDKGKVHIYHKKDFFIEQNKVSDQVGWIETGAFRYVHTDKHGKEHVVEYSFANEFVCDYSSFIHHLLNYNQLGKSCMYIQSDLLSDSIYSKKIEYINIKGFRISSKTYIDNPYVCLLYTSPSPRD